MTNTLTFNLPQLEDTQRLGSALAHLAQKGDFFALYGTLGMGKSVLARAFIQELSGAQEVPSPTFTLVQSYETSDFEIYHFDLYRLKHPDEIFEIGVEEAVFEGVSLVEWPERMQNYLPRKSIIIEIKPRGEGRVLTLSCQDTATFERFQALEADFR